MSITGANLSARNKGRQKVLLSRRREKEEPCYANLRMCSIIGFALGTTYGDESGGWKYGYVLWMGVSPRWQGAGVGAELYHEMERRMHQDGVRMTFVDTARSNTGAIKFFKRMGYGKPEAEVWMSKLLQRTRKGKCAQKTSVSRGRRTLPRRIVARRLRRKRQLRRSGISPTRPIRNLQFKRRVARPNPPPPSPPLSAVRSRPRLRPRPGKSL